MRLVFVLALAGAMVSTGFSPGPAAQSDKSFVSFIAYAVAVPETHDATAGRKRPQASSGPSAETVAAVPYPVGEDAMNDSMIKTNRSALAMPMPEVPIARVCAAMAAAAETHGLPVAFFARLIWQESRFHQSAVSPSGAKGVAQFMPRTAAAYGLENPFDPLESLLVSARFLRELHDAFGNLGLAAAAYNGGRTRVRHWLARRTKLPKETRNYVRIITGHEPEAWTVASESIDLVASLPQDAPCEGTAGLAYDNGPVTMPILLSDWVGETVRKRGGLRARGAKTYSLAARSQDKSQDKSRGSKSQDKTIVAANKESVGQAAEGTVRGKAGEADKPIAVADALPSL